MRQLPEHESDRKELDGLNAEPWMIDALAMNPDYVSWGPYEDYMWRRGHNEGPDEAGRTHDHGWEARVLVPSWDKFEWELDDMNECVNFYFAVNRESKECPACCGNGHHPDAQWITESFYAHSSPFKRQTASELRAASVLANFNDGRMPTNGVHGHNTFPDDDVLNRYGDAFRAFCEEMRASGGGWGEEPLHPEETQALENAGRSADGSPLVGHDAINHFILCEARCKRFGLPYLCPTCQGDTLVYTAAKGHLSLTLWMLHPSKGCSRGVEIKRIEKDDMRDVLGWLLVAAERNAQRFAKIPTITPIIGGKRI